MYAINSRATDLSPSEQYRVNHSSLYEIQNELTPTTTAALSLADTARQMKAAAVNLKSAGHKQLMDSQGARVNTKDLIASLKVAKDALKGVASASNSLSFAVGHLAEHQNKLYQGKMASVPLADKVNWCTAQTDKMVDRARKLGDTQRPVAVDSMNSIAFATRFVRGSIQTEDESILVHLRTLGNL